MRIGKTIKTVTSPQRKIKKSGEKVNPSIPVQLPTKVPEKVSAWKVDHRLSWGMDIGTKSSKTVYITTVA